MPYVFDDSRLSSSEDEEPIPPKAKDFEYMPATEFGGPQGAAELRVPTGSEGVNNEEFSDPQEARALHLALIASGIAKVYCRYDGGHDEGFAWVAHAELATGERLDTWALATKLIANGVPVRKRWPYQRDWPDELLVQELLDYPLAVNWAAALLGGHGFGTGEYSMYGAFVADLVAGTITDDPMAGPVVRNIEIDGAERAPLRPEPEPDLAMKGAEVTTPTDPPTRTYDVGDRVIHPKFGNGTVTEVDGNVLTVAFDSGGKKRIVGSFVDRE
jgi:hypothetical protein